MGGAVVEEGESSYLVGYDSLRAHWFGEVELDAHEPVLRSRFGLASFDRLFRKRTEQNETSAASLRTLAPSLEDSCAEEWLS